MSSRQLQLLLSSSSTPPSISLNPCHFRCSSNSLLFNGDAKPPANAVPSLSADLRHRHHHNRRRRPIQHVYAGGAEEDIAGARLGDAEAGNGGTATAVDEEEEPEPTPDDLEYVSQIKTVLELLRKNRDMLFGEVKLTIMIEDPREVERRRLLGIDDSDGPTREDLVAALEEVNEGKIPRDRVALRMLAEEMSGWPNLEAEKTKKSPKSRSLYAKATDTGINPEVAASRLNVDWDSAAEIKEEITDETEVPPAVGS